MIIKNGKLTAHIDPDKFALKQKKGQLKGWTILETEYKAPEKVIDVKFNDYDNMTQKEIEKIIFENQIKVDINGKPLKMNRSLKCKRDAVKKYFNQI